MIGTLILAGLAIIGIIWIASIAAIALWWHQQRWPNLACQCGQWTLDTDSGLVLPLVAGDMIHDHHICQPVPEYIHHPDDEENR